MSKCGRSDLIWQVDVIMTSRTCINDDNSGQFYYLFLDSIYILLFSESVAARVYTCI